MLTPFTESEKTTVEVPPAIGNENEDEDEANEDDKLTDDEDDEVDDDREAFDDQEVEDAMAEVNEEFKVSGSQAKAARSSLWKVRTSSSFHANNNTHSCAMKLKRLAKNLHHSSANAFDLEECCVKAKIPPRKMK